MTSSEIHPFRIDIQQADIDDLTRRLAAARWPSQPEGTGWTRGVPVDYLRGLATYWEQEYDWRAAEAELNTYPQFVTEIDGQRVHFLHVRSSRADATPMVLTHGWPGSIVEFLDLVAPLTEPPADDQAFHLVIPSIPGFGFSGPTTDPGWTSSRIAATWAELMERLGYDRYFAHGGDLGVGISRALGVGYPDRVIGVHVNGGFGYPIVDDAELATLEPKEQARVARMTEFMAEQAGYIAVQSTRPQTLAYGLQDSPVGQLAWIVERFAEWTDPRHELPEQAVDLVRMLTNVSIYWFTGTAGSASQIYWEEGHAGGWGEPEPLTVPSGVALFGTQDIAIRRLDERSNAIVHWTEFDHGGHFAAMEAGGSLVADLRAFAATVRSGAATS